MNYISSSSSKKKTKKRNSFWYILGIVICIAISLYLITKLNIPGISNITGKIVHGVSNVFSSIGGVVKEGTDYFGNTKSLKRKNEAQSEEIQKLKISLVEKEILKSENNDLKEMLRINEKYSHFNLKYAKVIYRTYDNWNDTFTIDIGTKDGIGLGNTVIAEKGLVRIYFKNIH